MLISWRARAYAFGFAGLGAFLHGATAAGEPPRIKHVTVYRETGRFAGWPANHGMWSWGDEILVGFSRGYYKDRGPYHHINKEKPEEFLLARSSDGGTTWAIEQPRPPGALVGTPGMRHGLMPPGASPEQPTELDAPIDFTHPDFAMTIRMENTNAGTSRYYFSTIAATRGKAHTNCRCSANPG